MGSAIAQLVVQQLADGKKIKDMQYRTKRINDAEFRLLYRGIDIGGWRYCKGDRLWLAADANNHAHELRQQRVDASVLIKWAIAHVAERAIA